MAKEIRSDFGSYCVEQWLSGRSPKTSYRFLAIDFMRNQAGTDRSGDLLRQFNKQVGSGRTVELMRLEHGSRDIERFENYSVLWNAGLNLRERWVMTLYYIWGYSFEEIGKLIGVSESMAKLIEIAAVKKVRARI